MFPSALIPIIVVLAFCGLILWALTQIPMDPTIAKIIRVVVIVFVVIWLIYALMGMAGGAPLFGHTGPSPCIR